MKHLLFILSILSLFVSCEKKAKLDKQMEETFYLSRAGSDMPVFVRGNGDSKTFILVLSGGPGNGGLIYRAHTYSDLLEEKYAMVYWDQRHQGNSHGHYNKEDITIDAMVEDTYALIKTLKQRYGQDISLFLMGHSWGGTLGTSYMVKNDYQKELKGWIEVDGAHDFPLMNTELVKMFHTVGSAEIAKGNHVDKWTEIINYTDSIDTTNLSDQEVTQLNVYAGRVEGYLDFLNPKSESNLNGLELNITGANNAATTLINEATLPLEFYQEITSTALTNEMSKITTPTLLQWGRYDFKVPLKLAELAFENISTADKELKIYEKSGHSPMRFEPELFVEDVINFVEKYK